jgi:hypothetical protein
MMEDRSEYQKLLYKCGYGKANGCNEHNEDLKKKKNYKYNMII